MSSKLNKKELKTLKNALGKQGLTLEDHENAEKSKILCEILQIDCFSMKTDENPADSEGWYLGYGVEFNGVGISQGAAESSSSSENGENRAENRENQQISEESSGFDSDPPSDEDGAPIELPNYDIRRDSDDISDRGQLLYGIAEENGAEPILYVDKRFSARNVNFQGKNEEKQFKTSEFIVTNRFEVAKSRESDEEVPEGYQICATSNSEGESDSEDFRSTSPEYPPNSTASSGLWCNFIVSLPNLEKDCSKKLEITEEKLKTIPLDEDKLAQISAAMANFKLPIPPGWEGVSDEKLIDFVKQRV